MDRDPAFMWETETLRARRKPSQPKPADSPTKRASPGPTDRAPAEWVTLREASAETGMAATTLRNWAKKGKVPGQLVEGRWMISLAAATERAAQLDQPIAAKAPAEQSATPPPGSVLVPLAAWDRMLDQLGNLHEAGQQLAEARERAAKAETESLFLRQQLADMRAAGTTATAPAVGASPAAEPTPSPAEQPNEGGIAGRFRRIAARVRR